ncbi:MAG: helix-turn-helix transcriptional regulator [Oscillospiraceae bacterium]
MITKFGKFLRNLRMDNGEILKSMAEKLEITSSFLSAVENGKKKIPEGWVNKIASLYSLSNRKQAELQNAYYETNECVEIELAELNRNKRELAFSFARKLNGFSDEEMDKLCKMFKEEDSNE